jgi:hypothetical protein
MPRLISVSQGPINRPDDTASKPTLEESVLTRIAVSK